MFPHTVTVINQYNNEIKKCVVEDVFYHVDKIIAPEGRGENFTNTHQVVFSENALKKYRKESEYNGEVNTFTLKENDVIIKGIYDGEISTFSELENIESEHFSIKGIHDNDYALNSYLTNIEVTD